MIEIKKRQRSDLTPTELNVLDEKVLPTAREWVRTYPESSPMWGHAKQTLAYWGEA